MTSKEALGYIMENCLDMWDTFIFSEVKKCFEPIKKDLEVFEILKRIDWLIYNNGDKNDFNWYIDTNKTMQITEEEAKKLKEWLENDK